MIELQFDPDGDSEIPADAAKGDHVVGVLNGATNIPDHADAPISDWRDVSRRVPGNRRYMALRVPGEPADYPGSTLDNLKNAILNEFAGLKADSDGWQYVGQG